MLPKVPEPFALGGIPVPGTDDQFIVTRDGLALLGAYLAGSQGWMTAASKCLAVQQ